MANSIINRFKDIISPIDAPGNLTDSGTSKELLLSSAISRNQADAVVNHITGQFAAKQNSANQTAAAKSSIDGTKKTAGDFFREITEQQPFDYDKLAKKKISVVLEAKKPAEQMSLADYELAKNRAIFKQAGYNLLTDEEIRMAIDAIESKGVVKNRNFELASLRKEDAKAGAMFIDTNQATIEIAKRAGQAVLQYKNYQSQQADANKLKAESETNQMFADQGRVVWNSGVNIAEGTINQAMDAALTSGGTNPIPLLNPNRPQVDFSSAKSDYRSEMMRRDLNGKLDGDGIKKGEAIETGVTLIAPLIVGKVIVPNSAPQSLKTLGGIPEIKATSSATTVAKQGKIIETQDKFLPEEKSLAEFLAKEGKTVEKLPENSGLPGRKADAMVDGVKTEFKKPKVGATNVTIKDEINNSIRKMGQARNIIIDARGTGLTKAEAQRGLARASGISRGRIDSARIIGDGFDITATNFK